MEEVEKLSFSKYLEESKTIVEALCKEVEKIRNKIKSFQL